MATTNNNYKQEALQIMGAIMNDISSSSKKSGKGVTYNDQRALIRDIFCITGGSKYSKESIILRLTVIDSMYSTNARYNYFSIAEMADEILNIGNESTVRDYFYDVAQLKNCPTARNFFNRQYGIHKNLDKGDQNLSLLTKYAYYDLLQNPQKYPLGFPIYDKLAKNTCRTLKTNKKASLFISNCTTFKKSNAFKDQSTTNINDYILVLDDLRKSLFGNNDLFLCKYQQFDTLDAYLWRMGKFSKGNLSLLLDKMDYIKFITNIHLNNSKTHSSNDFDKEIIKHLKYDRNPFKGLSNQSYLNHLLAHWKKYN